MASINARLERLEEDAPGKTIIVGIRHKSRKEAQQAITTAEQLAGRNGRIVIVRRKNHEANKQTHRAA